MPHRARQMFGISLRAHELFGAAGLLFLTVSCSSMYWFLANSLAVAYEAASAGNRNVAISLERSVRQQLETTDHRLVVAREAVLSGRPLGAETIPGVTVLDVSGRRLIEAAGEEAPLVAASIFARHRDEPGLGVLISGPEMDRTSRGTALTLSRRIVDNAGAFRGVVAGTVPIEAFQRLFRGIDVGSRGVLRLIGTDAKLWASRPAADTRTGQSVVINRLFQELGQAPSGMFRKASTIDGIERIFVYNQVEGFPLVLLVGTAVNDIREQWLGKAAVGCALFLFFLVAAALLGLELRREFSRRELAEQAARDSERKAQASAARLRQLMDNVTDLLVHIDWSGRALFVSPACRQILGRGVETLWGTSLFALIHPDDLERVRASLHRLQNGQVVASVSCRALHRDGIWRYVEARGQHLPDGSGAIMAVRDVTERMALETKLQQAHRMEALGQLTAGVSHDFNNMLQAQLGTLELLMDRLDSDPPALKLASKALELGEKGARLTSQLLSFSRRQLLVPQAIATGPFLHDFADIVRRTLGPAITVTVRAAEGMPPIFADSANLESALMNLALNARDAMQDGGVLTIRATYRTQEATLGTASMPLGFVTIGLHDSGVGMDGPTMARACEPFFTTKGLKGTGLGLASVQGFVEQSGGTMTIVSSPGQGTSIELNLPSGGTPAAPSDRTATISDHGGRLLLVDDQEDVLDSIGQLLRDAGFEVVCALGPIVALQAVEAEEPFDCMVTDYMMPGLDGRGLVRAVHERYPGLPALLITGWADLDDAECRAEFAAILRKPFTRDTLVQHVSCMVAGSRLNILDATHS